MALMPMYPGQPNSPQTELAENIDETQTTIPLLDASVLPPGPNLAVIGGGEHAETVLYESIDGDNLINCTRGFQGVASSWQAGQKVARNFTAYDYDALRQNLKSHGSEHNHDGADPIPDLVQLRDDFNVLIATGVIVESGENANGQYVRFADGTQICWTRKTGGNINLNISQQDYPYPAAFVSNPTTPFGVSMSFVVSDTVRNALLNSFVIGSNTQWSVRIPSEARTEDSADGATGYHLMAIGRWK